MSLIYSDCYLLTDIDFNSKRISHLLERRFKINSYETSFDFKSLRPEQPSNNAKVSRSLLRYQPKLQYFHGYDDNSSSNSSSDDDDDNNSETMTSINEEDEDDYLNKLAEWEPANFQASAETDDEEEETMQSVDTDNDDDSQSAPMNICSSSKPTSTQSPTDDLVVTYVHRPSKSEPIPYEENIFDCLPQFDGQVDYLSTKQSTGKNNDKRLDDVVAKIQARKLQPSKTIQIHDIPSKSNRFRLTDNNKYKPVIPSPKKPPAKIDRPKETNLKTPKPIKKAPPRLLSSLLKSNEDAIRPLFTPIPPTVPLIQKNPMNKTQRLQSESSLPLLSRKSHDSNKILAQKQRQSEKIPQKRSSSLSLVNKPQLKERSAKHYMSLAHKEYKHFQKHQQTRTQPVSLSANEKLKQTTKKTSKSSISTIDSLFRKSESSLTLNNTIGQKKEKHKKIKPLDIPTKTLPISKSTQNQTSQRSQITSDSSSYLYIVPSSPTLTSSKRPANYFEGCIELDDDDDNEESNPTKNTTDDDIQEIEKPHYSIAYSIYQREKLLDYPVHSPSMHIQWLTNLEHILLEHISICHENNIRPSLNSSTQTYRIDPELISKTIIGFLKLFILRNSAFDQQEAIFLQFGLTSHLRYLLIELPTWNHTDEKDSQNECKHCHQYSLIMNILFDLLFDLIEYDLCENYTKEHYRSTLIENDYFTRFLQSKPTHKDQYYRIKFVIYFIELLAVHMNKCSNQTQFQFNKNENILFYSMENFIRQILTKTQTRNQRLAICFNVLELCLLFVNEKVDRIKQMSTFLVDLCANNPSYRNLFLSEKNLFVDIRLLFINELINTNYSIKLTSIDRIQNFFGRIQIRFNSTTASVDEDLLLLLRSLFSSYADLLHELKSIDIYLPISQKELRIILETEFDLIYQKLLKLSAESQQSFEHMKKSLFSFRLLKCKWNKL